MSDRILVIGGLSGIGAGVADRFGARCSVWSRRSGGVDATDPASVRRAAGAYLAEHGAPFGLVHTVGEFDERPLCDTDDALYRRMVESNLTSAFLVTRALVPAMAANGQGRVVLFAASGAADPTAKTRAPVYFAVKAAVISLARSLAREVAPSGVTVNVISPGVIRHPSSHAESQDRMEAKVPLGRAGTVEDVVGTVEFLLSDAGAYITGEELNVDGGLRL